MLLSALAEAVYGAQAAGSNRDYAEPTALLMKTLGEIRFAELLH